jgi:protein-L-isoaspartate(D-aspartate) O-methyltransferase
MKNAIKIIKIILAGTVLASFATATSFTAIAAETNSPVPPASSDDTVIQIEAQKIAPGSAPAQQQQSKIVKSQAIQSAVPNAAGLSSQQGTGANSRSGAPAVVMAPPPRPQENVPSVAQMSSSKPSLNGAFDAARQRMVTDQLAGPSRGIANKAVLEAMGSVPRHQFVLSQFLGSSYEDKALDIGFNRTIESPYVVASVAEQLDASTNFRVLELGTGAGYQTAVLSKLVKEIYSVEPQEELAQNAIVNFERLGYTNNVFVRHGELAQGWPDAAPFDAIVVNAGSDQLSGEVMAQLKEGGLIIFDIAGDANIRLVKKQGNQKIMQSSRFAHPAPVAGNNVSMDQFRRSSVKLKRTPGSESGQ